MTLPSVRDTQAKPGKILRTPAMSTESLPDLDRLIVGGTYKEETIVSSTEKVSVTCPSSTEGTCRRAENIVHLGLPFPAIFAPAMVLDPGSAEESQSYRAGRWAAEHKEEIFDFASDPINLIAIVVLLAVVASTIMLLLKLSIKALRSAWDALNARPGQITLGVRRGELLHHLTDSPVRITFEDARKGGVVLVGPTGQGKTTALLLMLVQALLHGHTVILLEADGNLGLRLLKYARAIGLGKRCFHYDPSTADSWKWNPLSGDPERAVRRAVNTVLSVSQNHPFFGGLNENVMRQMTKLTIAYAGHAGLEPTLRLLLRLLTDHRHLCDLLDVASDTTREPEIRALFVDAELKTWLEQEYLSWNPKVRGEYLLGLRNFLRSLM